LEPELACAISGALRRGAEGGAEGLALPPSPTEGRGAGVGLGAGLGFVLGRVDGSGDVPVFVEGRVFRSGVEITGLLLPDDPLSPLIGRTSSPLCFMDAGGVLPLPVFPSEEADGFGLRFPDPTTDDGLYASDLSAEDMPAPPLAKV
jgi:hypothetical protein